MSGPKCDDFFLSDEEYERQKREEEARFQREQELIRQRELNRQREQNRQRAKAMNACAKEVMQQLQELESQEQKVLRNEFEEVYLAYQAAAELAKEPVVFYEFAPQNASFVIENLKEEITRLREKKLQMNVEHRINQIVDETLEEMGYELLGTGEGTEEIQTCLYQYDDSCAISVIEEHGQISMEVVALDTKARRATEEEADMLASKMESFCDIYEKLCEEIKRDGRLKQQPVFHRKPDKKYARIVNKNQYQPAKHKKKYSEDYLDEQNSIQGRGSISHM